MKRFCLITAIILVVTASFAYAQMHEGMMGGAQQGQEPAVSSQGTYPHIIGPGGYGMMGQGHGGHMMGGMMGAGGHMAGAGCEGHMMEGMMGPDMMGFGTEEEYRKHLDDTVDLRRAMHNKKFEMSEAMRNPETTHQTLLKLKKEMLEIKVKIYEKAIKSN